MLADGVTRERFERAERVEESGEQEPDARLQRQDVWRREHHEAARLQDARNFSEELFVTVDVFEYLDGDCGIEGSIIERQSTVAGHGAEFHEGDVELLGDDVARAHP